MASVLRGLVSKNKIRFKDDQEGFDLDLTYITSRIIAMGFPSSDMEGLYRNPIGEVYRFFELRHKDNYKLYNLYGLRKCAERDYDHAKFHGRVSRYPFEDHNAPPIDLIVQCCADIHQWLAEDENHVVGINCKAGKGRTGLIICCYLMHSKVCGDSEEAMVYYGTRRTRDGKGVTIASQQRYVRYYNEVLKIGGVPPEPRLLMLKSIRVHTVPDFSGDPYVVIISKNQEVCRSTPTPVPKKATHVDLVVDRPVHGDVKIQFCVKKGGSHQNTCHFWFSTAFVDPKTNAFELKKSEIDVANKDKKNAHFKQDFRLEVTFESIDVPTSPKPKKEKKKDKKSTETAEVVEHNGSSPAPSKDKKKKKDTGAAEASPSATPAAEPAAEPAAPASTEVASPKPKKAVVIAAENSADSGKVKKDKKEPKEDKSKDEGFQQRRKRAQSFYDTSSSDEGLSSSEIDEKHMDAYFEAEVDEDENGAAKQDLKASSNGSPAPSDEVQANGHNESAETHSSNSDEAPAKAAKSPKEKKSKKK